jgi:hypothetical protein
MIVPRRTFALGLGALIAGSGGAGWTRDAGDAPNGLVVDLVPSQAAETGPPPPPWAAGYTAAELDAAQERYDLAFPPDLIALLREQRPTQGYDWRTDDAAIREMLRRPLDGLLFDVEHNVLWLPEWGERPPTPQARAEVVAQAVARAPKLIPIFGHRYLPAEPHEAGNPVFSVVQSDIIYYGVDLADYFEREFGDPRRPLPRPAKRIAFWSDFAEGRAPG